MILMPQIFDVTANENARYKRNELEWSFFFTYYVVVTENVNWFDFMSLSWRMYSKI